MEFLLSLMALLIAFAGGAGAISLLAPSRWRENPIGFAGAAFVVGAGIISVLSFCLGFVIQGGLLRWIITITCLVLFVLGRVRCVKQGCKAERPSVNAVEVLLGILVIGQLWLVTWLSLCKSGLGWDGLFNWEAKALICFPTQRSDSTGVLYEWLRDHTRCLSSVPFLASGLGLRVAGPHRPEHGQADRTISVPGRGPASD
jgi:hypothetical protein